MLNKQIPTNQQIANEFGFSSKHVSLMRINKDSVFQIYRESWLYRLICSSLTHTQKDKLTYIIPTREQINNEFGDIKNKKSDTYSIALVDAWNLRQVFFKKLCDEDFKMSSDVNLNTNPFLGLNNTTKHIPINSQIKDSLNLSSSTLYSLKKDKRSLYVKAWLYKTILLFIPRNYQSFKEQVPSDSQLVEEFGKTKQNYNSMRLKGTNLYEIYENVWNLEHNVFSKIIKCA